MKINTAIVKCNIQTYPIIGVLYVAELASFILSLKCAISIRNGSKLVLWYPINPFKYCYPQPNPEWQGVLLRLQAPKTRVFNFYNMYYRFADTYRRRSFWMAKVKAAESSSQNSYPKNTQTRTIIILQCPHLPRLSHGHALLKDAILTPTKFYI